MKEMLGGCCVCAEENGWEENPLIYCDGPGCEVAVHQGCYGIQVVPEEEWYCAKCHVSTSFDSRRNGVGPDQTTDYKAAVNARCELCPFGYGALKRTNKNGWAHVVCALYIPEVRFGDVHSMDPIIVTDIPQERFAKPCYICAHQGDLAASAIGATMSCNKLGCKRRFHVTCGQQRGLLCEESGDSKNVKYCGFCGHHMKKAALDPSIKRIPPCRVRAHPTSAVSVLPSQPTPPSSNNSGHMLVDPIPRPEQLSSVLGGLSQVVVTDDGAAHLVNNFSPPLTTSSRSSVAFDATPPLSTNHQIINKMEPILNGPSTSSLNALVNVAMGQNHNRLCGGSVVAGVVPAAETNGHHAVEEKPPVDGTYTSHTVTPTVSKAHSAASKRVRERDMKQEPGMEKAKKPRTNNNRPSKNMKALLDAVGPVVSETVSDFQRERVAGRTDAERRLTVPVGSTTTLPSTSGHETTTPQQPPHGPATTVSHVLGTSPSTSRAAGSTLPSSMEQLLERQWDQGSQFLISQAAQFDVAQLLSCLHQLKSENIRLEEQLSQLTKRREHLLALNTRLSVPLSVPTTASHQQPLLPSPHHSPQVPPTSANLPAAAEDTLSQMRSLVSGGGGRMGGLAQPVARPPSQAASTVPSTSYQTPIAHYAQNRLQQSSANVACSAPSQQPPASSVPSSSSNDISSSNISPERLASLNPLASLGNNFLTQRSSQMMPGMGVDHLVTQLLLQQAQQQLRYQQNPSTANLFASFSSLIPPISGPGTVQGGNMGK